MVSGKEGILDGRVTAARLLQLVALAPPSMLFANTDRAGELHRRIVSKFGDCVLETAADKPCTFHVRPKHWAETIFAQQQQRQPKQQSLPQEAQTMRSKRVCACVRACVCVLGGYKSSRKRHVCNSALTLPTNGISIRVLPSESF